MCNMYAEKVVSVKVRKENRDLRSKGTYCKKVLYVNKLKVKLKDYWLMDIYYRD